jgi:hypothetical protein
VFAVEDATLRELVETPIDRGLDLFRREDGRLTPGSAAIRSAWP